MLHVAGFVTICEAFLGMEPHVDFFRRIFNERALSKGKLARTARGWWLCPIEEAKFIGILPRVHPLRLQSGVARGVVLHKESGGGVVLVVHRKETGEA